MPFDRPLSIAEAQRNAASVKKCLDQLAEKHPEAATLVQRVRDGASSEEIWGQLGMSSSQGSRLKSTTLENLRLCLEPEGLS